MNQAILQSKGRIGLFVFRYPVAYSPSIIHSATMLAETGYDVDILVDRFVFDEIERTHPRITVTYCTDLPPIRKSQASQHTAIKTTGNEAMVSALHSASPARMFIRQLVPSTVRRRLWHAFSSIWSQLHSGKDWINQWLLPMFLFLVGSQRHFSTYKHKYTYLIGVEPEGLVIAAFWARLWNVPFYYHSLELFEPAPYAHFRDRLRKRLEKWANQRARFSIAQDHERAKRLAIANSIPVDSIRIIPVSELGPTVMDKTNFLHERLGIDRKKRIVLVLGAIYDLNMSQEIANQTLAPNWPDEFVLVFHGFTGSNTYLANISRLIPSGRVLLSLESVSFSQISELVASAMIGIALYRPINKNFELTAYSSGKIAQYLKCGLPIIVNDFPSTKRMISEFDCGKYVSGPDDLISAIRSIMVEYERFRTGAVRAFEASYTFQRHFDQVIRSIETPETP